MASHFHQCSNLNCQNIWQHNSDRNWTYQQHQDAHTCGQCGSKQVYKFTGEISPNQPIGESKPIEQVISNVISQPSLDGHYQDNELHDFLAELGFISP